MPILERAAPPAGPDVTQTAIEEIRAALRMTAPSEDAVVDPTDPADADAEGAVLAATEPPAVRETVGHGAIRLRGRPVGLAQGT
jgi:hypothetical protein